MSWRQWRFALCWLLVLARPSFAGTQVYFTSQESVEERMVRLIERSTASIDIALFELRSAKLAAALEQAKGQGVRVRLILDASHRQQDLSAGEVRCLAGKNGGGRGVMHHKFALFDHKQVVTGSFNWTPGAEHANYENALLLDDPETVNAYGREFETLWRRAVAGPPPSGTASGTNNPERRSKSRHSIRNYLKCIKIRMGRPVMKCRRKAHTNRP